MKFPINNFPTNCKCFTAILAILINLSIFFSKSTLMFLQMCLIVKFSSLFLVQYLLPDETMKIQVPFLFANFPFNYKIVCRRSLGWPLCTSDQMHLLNHEASEHLIARWLFADFASALFSSLSSIPMSSTLLLVTGKSSRVIYSQPHVWDFVG